ncbi:hypothetical protein BDF19DRAFT_424881 [Syncephalis fuscata]|nr:hypothetical protein BDF19DRAFT_424881 [Syncephalis fuscata]
MDRLSYRASASSSYDRQHYAYSAGSSTQHVFDRVIAHTPTVGSLLRNQMIVDEYDLYGEHPSLLSSELTDDDDHYISDEAEEEANKENIEPAKATPSQAAPPTRLPRLSDVPELMAMYRRTNRAHSTRVPSSTRPATRRVVPARPQPATRRQESTRPQPATRQVEPAHPQPVIRRQEPIIMEDDIFTQVSPSLYAETRPTTPCQQSHAVAMHIPPVTCPVYDHPSQHQSTSTSSSSMNVDNESCSDECYDIDYDADVSWNSSGGVIDQRHLQYNFNRRIEADLFDTISDTENNEPSRSNKRRRTHDHNGSRSQVATRRNPRRVPIA